MKSGLSHAAYSSASPSTISLASSNSSRPSANVGCCSYWSRNAFLLMSLSYCVRHLSKRCRMLVWLASINPLTLCAVCTYGLFRLSATWMLAGAHSMKLASRRSRIRCRLLCTCVGSTSPWMMLRMEMYLLCPWSFPFPWLDTMMFFVWSRRRMTSNTDVFRTAGVAAVSSVSGVYPVIAEVAPGRRDQGRDQTDQVVVHVPRVPEASSWTPP